jgi:hypothetical protein
VNCLDPDLARLDQWHCDRLGSDHQLCACGYGSFREQAVKDPTLNCALSCGVLDDAPGKDMLFSAHGLFHRVGKCSEPSDHGQTHHSATDVVFAWIV